MVFFSVLSLISVAITDMLVVFGWSFQMADLIGAGFINVYLIITMVPLSFYCSGVLLQATPEYISSEIDSLRSELTTMDGVLEVKNAHFWSVGFEEVAGSIHLRISRNTDQQQVLASIMNKVYPTIRNCEIQVRNFKKIG